MKDANESNIKAETKASNAKFEDVPYESSTELLDEKEFIKDCGLCQTRALWGIIAICLSMVLSIIAFSLSACVLHEDFSWNKYLKEGYFDKLQKLVDTSLESSNSTNSSEHMQSRHQPTPEPLKKLKEDDFYRQLVTYLIGVMIEGYAATCLLCHLIIYVAYNNDRYRVKFGRLFCIGIILCEAVGIILSIGTIIEYNEKYDEVKKKTDSVQNFTKFQYCKMGSGKASIIEEDVGSPYVCLNYTLIFVSVILLAIVCILLVSVAFLLKSRKSIYIEEKDKIPDLLTDVPLPQTITIEVTGSETSTANNTDLKHKHRKKSKDKNPNAAANSDSMITGIIVKPKK